MSPQRLVFVGTYTEPILFGTGQVLQGKGRGIYAFRLDGATGALRPCGLTEGVRNPSYLAFHPSRRFLYAVNEFKEFEGEASGAISAFALDAQSGDLALLNVKATHGTDPCHLTVHPAGRFVLVANFASGSVCVLPIQADGSLGDASHVVQHHGSSVDPVRQKGPHAHAVTFDAAGRYLFVPDLGLDKVLIYRFDAQQGRLTPGDTPWVETAPGAGPRQVVFHPGGAFAYLINELDSTMTAFRYDAERGALEPLQTLSTLPADFAGRSTCAEVQIAPSGAYLYGSNRGHDSIATMGVDPATGMIAPLAWQPTQGSYPRNFYLSPGGDWILVANQKGDNIVSYRVDAATGRLAPTGHALSVSMPVCLLPARC